MGRDLPGRLRRGGRGSLEHTTFDQQQTAQAQTTSNDSAPSYTYGQPLSGQPSSTPDADAASIAATGGPTTAAPGVGLEKGASGGSSESSSTSSAASSSADSSATGAPAAGSRSTSPYGDRTTSFGDQSRGGPEN